jgi:hypothetical protein
MSTWTSCQGPGIVGAKLKVSSRNDRLVIARIAVPVTTTNRRVSGRRELDPSDSSMEEVIGHRLRPVGGAREVKLKL